MYSIGGNYLVCLAQSSSFHSKWADILVTLLYHTKQRTHYGNAIVYENLIKQFNDLKREGIEIGNFIVRPVILLCHGDNKSINEYTG